MTLEEFKSSLNKSSVPNALENTLQAMWFDGRGDWNKAHEVAQEIHSKEGAWIHAYLHRKEGDQSNATYWYHRANHTVCTASLAEEWEQIVSALLH